MKTAKGNNYAMLLGISVNDKVITLPLRECVDINTEPEYLTKMQDDIAARIILDTKPAATLQKQLERIEHHKEQMLDAYKLLFDCYQGMITPKSRATIVDKARRDMMNAMDNKMIRHFASMYLSVNRADNYVLPDERDQLVADTVAVMKLNDTPVSESV